MSFRTCELCGTEFEGRANAAYCSRACRQKAYRQRAGRSVRATSPDRLLDALDAAAAAGRLTPEHVRRLDDLTTRTRRAQSGDA